MDEMIKNSIDGRRNAFSSIYEIKDEKLVKKINDLFKKIEELGKNCSDVMDFETKFASSPLNQEYTDLFTEVATTCKMIEKEEFADQTVKSDKEYMMDEIKSEAKYQMDNLTMPARRKAREAFDSKMRDTPLGKVEQLSNTASVFKRIFKK